MMCIIMALDKKRCGQSNTLVNTTLLRTYLWQRSYSNSSSIDGRCHSWPPNTTRCYYFQLGSGTKTCLACCLFLCVMHATTLLILASASENASACSTRPDGCWGCSLVLLFCCCCCCCYCDCGYSHHLFGLEYIRPLCCRSCVPGNNLSSPCHWLNPGPMARFISLSLGESGCKVHSYAQQQTDRRHSNTHAGWNQDCASPFPPSTVWRSVASRLGVALP
ncbi:hypothetical protein B0T19DRAFT_216087 [Cercophora scortea]|uniref:Uncharacterized protein n=1 Tax=Cercophora scortea TaxID=314031 RepID=A0AAE0IEZ0_9PEZI|nr:hypothetical protein B0T19DRAFT_216087 [Cercophora scortea]